MSITQVLTHAQTGPIMSGKEDKNVHKMSSLKCHVCRSPTGKNVLQDLKKSDRALKSIPEIIVMMTVSDQTFKGPLLRQ